jgi:hypothetical protein
MPGATIVPQILMRIGHDRHKIFRKHALKK